MHIATNDRCLVDHESEELTVPPLLGSWDAVSLRRCHPDFLEMEVSKVMGVPPNHPSHLTIPSGELT